MKKSILGLVVVLLVASVTTVSALTWNPFKGAGRVKNSDLLLVGNVVPARLLADLAQWYTKQPVLLISPDADGESRVYYAPAASRATAVEKEKFLEVVDFINPNRVIVIGGEDIVDKEFVNLVSEKYKVLVLDSGNWGNNASALGELLDVAPLRSKFDEFMMNLKKVSENQKN